MKHEFAYDPVTRPEHYTKGPVECIDAMIELYGANAVSYFCICNAFKYLWRRKDKGNEEQDIEKALWYFDKYRDLIEEYA